MRSIQTRIIFFISTIMLVAVTTFLIMSIVRTKAILEEDSEEILLTTAEYYSGSIDDDFSSVEQSVGTIYNYALKRAETYRRFLEDEAERDRYAYEISELSKSIAENSDGAMAVYIRFNPDDYGPSNGFWYTLNLDKGSWQSSTPTDMSLYDKDDVEHVGWYYVPVNAGVPMWMDPYYNANVGVDMISYIIPYYYGNYTVGIIGMDISMDLLKEKVAGIKVYESGRAFLITPKGDLIYHEKYPDGCSFDALEADAGTFLSGVLQMEHDVTNVVTGADGTRWKLVLKQLQNGMILGIYAPLNEINAPQDALVWQQILISAAILAAAVLLSLFWVRSIINPLKKMTVVAERYAKGDFGEEIRVEGEDEIGILSHSLQTMSTSLQKQIEIADTANRAKSEFLSNMSHEIRTPINAVLGMNEMILRDATDKKIVEYATNIRLAGKTLLSLVNSILDFSKIESGKMEIIPISYDTAGFINNLVNSISERARAKGLELETRIDERLPSRLFGDDVRLSQVIMNLLTNAVKYTKEGTVTLCVKEAGRSGDAVELYVEVADTGIGIRKEDMEKLFESFGRIEERKNRNIEGTGLGMSIVTRLLDMMGSKLEVESTYGRGSRFSFKVRQQIVDARALGKYENRLRKSRTGRGAGDALKMDRARILVVDDYEMNLTVMHNFLGLYGIVPDLARSGQEALDAIRRGSYDIVFLDHMMPGMDGIETLAKVKEEGLNIGGMRVIALTANAVVGAKETYLKAGFDDYLSKPIEVDRLEKVLLTYLPKELIERGTAEEDEEAPSPLREKAEPLVAEAEDGAVLLEFAPQKKNENNTVQADGGAGASVPKNDEGTEDPLPERLKELGLSTEEGLRFCGGRKELYLELLRDYASDCRDKSTQLESNYQTRDWEAYRILVHALKSGSRTIGAKEIAEKAFALENASKASDAAFLEKHHGAFIVEYRKLASRISDAMHTGG